jgi:spermidine/putrescine-binding protein
MTGGGFGGCTVNLVRPDAYPAGVLDPNVLEGTTYAVPWYVDTRVLFYRTDLLRAAGHPEPPRTWDDWVVAMTRVVRYRSQYGHHTLRFNFICEPAGGDIRVDGAEILDARWFTHEEIGAIEDGIIRTPAIARTIIADIAAERFLPVDIVLDATDA